MSLDAETDDWRSNGTLGVTADHMSVLHAGNLMDSWVGSGLLLTSLAPLLVVRLRTAADFCPSSRCTSLALLFTLLHIAHAVAIRTDGSYPCGRCEVEGGGSPRANVSRDAGACRHHIGCNGARA